MMKRMVRKLLGQSHQRSYDLDHSEEISGLYRSNSELVLNSKYSNFDLTAAQRRRCSASDTMMKGFNLTFESVPEIEEEDEAEIGKDENGNESEKVFRINLFFSIFKPGRKSESEFKKDELSKFLFFGL